MKTALAATLLLLGANVAAAADGWLQHELSNGAVAGVPLSVFESTPSQGAVGDVYTDASGEVSLEVFGWENPDGSSLKTFARQIRDDLADERETTYERVGKSFFVQSGYLRDPDDNKDRSTIFYDRTERAQNDARMVTVRLTYPVARRGEIDPLVRAIGNRVRRPR